MLQELKKLDGFIIHATDGEIGHVEDVFFDDQKWIVRYIVVRTGSWLFGKEVLLSPVNIQEISWNKCEIVVNLTKKQVEESPSVETEKPISRQQEIEFSQYFGFPVYWGGAGFWGDAVYPGSLAGVGIAGKMDTEEEEKKKEETNHHLRSVNEVRGYRIHTKNEEFGHVEDLILDDSTWALRYLEVHNRQLFHGKKVLLSPRWIRNVNWAEAAVHVEMDKETILGAPEYGSDVTLDRDYELKLFAWYKVPGYWDEEKE